MTFRKCYVGIDGVPKTEDLQSFQKNDDSGEVCMEDVKLGPREQKITELLLQGCDNAEIAKEMNMARRTVKAHFNRLFLRFGIRNGIKRVKLATLLYRRQLWLEKNDTETEIPVSANSESSNWLPRDSRTAKSQPSSEPLNTSSRTTSASSTTSSDSGTGLSSPSGTKPDVTEANSGPEQAVNWEPRLAPIKRAEAFHELHD